MKEERERVMSETPQVTRDRGELEREPSGPTALPQPSELSSSSPTRLYLFHPEPSEDLKWTQDAHGLWRVKAVSAHDRLSTCPCSSRSPRPARCFPRGTLRSLQPPVRAPLRASVRAGAALLDTGSLAVRLPWHPQGKTLPVEVMCAEEAQKHSRRRAEKRARLPSEDPSGYHEGGQLLQEPGGAGGQPDSRGHQGLRVLPVTRGLCEVQDQQPQGSQSGAACQHWALLA